MISDLAMSLVLGFALGLAPLAFFFLATALGFFDDVGIALSLRVGDLAANGAMLPCLPEQLDRTRHAAGNETA
jgi:hypothetical protein